MHIWANQGHRKASTCQEKSIGDTVLFMKLCALSADCLDVRQKCKHKLHSIKEKECEYVCTALHVGARA